jgi:two-component system response regulator
MKTPVILLVEDNTDDELLTVRALRRANVANDIVIAHDGVEALDYLFEIEVHAEARRIPEVVLLDLRLPRIDGLEVLKRLRADSRMERVPVVILTASREESDRLTGCDAGPSQCVQKPVDFPALVEAGAFLGLSWSLVRDPALEQG